MPNIGDDSIALVAYHEKRVICLMTNILAITKRSDMYATSASLPRMPNPIVAKLIRVICIKNNSSLVMVLSFVSF